MKYTSNGNLTFALCLPIVEVIIRPTKIVLDKY